MINTQRMQEHLNANHTTWKELAADIGGIPSDLQTFADTFEDEATADTIAAIVAGLDIPAAEIGPTFFAPAEYDENDAAYHPAEPEAEADVLEQIFHGLDLKHRVRLVTYAFRLQDQQEEEARA